MTNNIVQARNIRKSFGHFTALDNISFNVAPGSIVGLIGPNGAGKTTTLKSLLGLTTCQGELAVVGMDPRSRRHKLMEHVCFIADVGILPRWLGVAEAIDFMTAIHPKFNRQKAETFIAATKIAKQQKIRQLSKGMVTQLHLALVMAMEVELLVLDEPTLGLDILYRKTFYDHLLNDYFDHKTSIIISTHQVEEIENLLTHLLFINQGQIVLDRAMDDLANHYREVLVSPEQFAVAEALGPISSKDVLGKKRMIFEQVAADQLRALGECQVPSVADLFVAKLGSVAV